MSLTIVADQNIAFLNTYFAAIGKIVKVDGRNLPTSLLKKADILLVRSVTSVNEALLADTPIRFVGSATIGIDHLDTTYLEQAHISWAYAPGSSTHAVVDYVLSAFCALDGLWHRLLHGATVGIIGLGRIGSALYQRLNKLNIQCCAYDPLIASHSYPILATFEQTLAADVVCLHTPLTNTGHYPTHHLLDAPQLAQLHDHAVVLNAGRGAVINNQALYDCLIKQPNIQVILDVWEHEPLIMQPLIEHVRLATPHIAGYSIEGKQAATAMLQVACCQALGLTPPHFNTPEANTAALWLDDCASENGLRQAILKGYDIRRDNQMMRTAYQASPNIEANQVFDNLRKYYPTRHELAYYRPIGNNGFSGRFERQLQALGFNKNFCASL